MSDKNDAHVLVVDGQKAPIVQSLTQKRWQQLSLTYRETRLNLDGVPIWVKYQAWLEPTAVTAACWEWMSSCEGVPF